MKDQEWNDEKQRVTVEWDASIEAMRLQFQEEERHNEMIRRLPEEECQRMVEELKQKLVDEETRKADELARIKAQIEQEKSRNAEIMPSLRTEV